MKTTNTKEFNEKAHGPTPQPAGIVPEDWEVKKLEEIGGFFKGKGISKSDLVEEGLNAIRYGEIYTVHNFFVKRFYSFITAETAQGSFKIQKGDILFAGSGETLGEIGKSVAFLGDEEVYAGGDIIVLRPKENTCNPKFLGFLTNNDVFRRQTYRLGQGNSVVHIYPSNLKKIHLPLPPLPEQRAIAACLGAWDRSIENLAKLVEAKKEQKKGLMQQLLTGKKRLEGFGGEWEEVGLGEIGETFNGLTGKTKDDFGGGKPYVSYLNVFNNNKIGQGTKFDFVNIKEGENQKELNYGDLIFTTSSETPDEVGMSSVILYEPKESIFLNSFCFGLRLENFDKLLPEFAVYVLRGNDFRKEMYKMAQGSTRFNLSKSGFRKIELKIPSLKEQTAIASILAAADKEIGLLEKKLSAFRAQKKGLMQVLLTGKKRLNHDFV